ncbi:Nin1 binding protein [Xylographa carneopallida]|nr:Nin1 binding protein [Xylographa carneopallida]
MDIPKVVHSIILDSSPLLVNEPSVSTLLAKSERIFTIPQVITEIRDRDARARLEVTVLPFLTIRSPRPESVTVIVDFARRTGDLAVLSSPDIHLLALAYELEFELNHGDWRLRKVPGQKRLNGPPPPPVQQMVPDYSNAMAATQSLMLNAAEPLGSSMRPALEGSDNNSVEKQSDMESSILIPKSDLSSISTLDTTTEDLHFKTHDDEVVSQSPVDDMQPLEEAPRSEAGESDSDGWITPSNIKKLQVKDQLSAPATESARGKMQVATITSDYAMQNVLLQMNLNLLSTSMLRVRQLKTHVLRCHACFEKTKDMTKQFCQRCGKPTLTRVSCSTNANGEFQIHLKKNIQWNHRGDRYSIPKPVSNNSNGKVGTGKGGGKGGWGQELILAEDQKEYQRAITGQNRKKERNLMDDDYLPGILTGERNRAGGKPKVGAGRNVNSKKR